MIKKRSLKINGHATSISLENEFWDALKSIAAEKAIPLSTLIATIDQNSPPENGLSSTLRIYALRHTQKRIDALLSAEQTI